MPVYRGNVAQVLDQPILKGYEAVKIFHRVRRELQNHLIIYNFEPAYLAPAHCWRQSAPRKALEFSADRSLVTMRSLRSASCRWFLSDFNHVTFQVPHLKVVRALPILLNPSDIHAPRPKTSRAFPRLDA